MTKHLEIISNSLKFHPWCQEEFLFTVRCLCSVPRRRREADILADINPKGSLHPHCQGFGPQTCSSLRVHEPLGWNDSTAGRSGLPVCLEIVDLPGLMGAAKDHVLQWDRQMPITSLNWPNISVEMSLACPLLQCSVPLFQRPPPRWPWLFFVAMGHACSLEVFRVKSAGVFGSPWRVPRGATCRASEEKARWCSPSEGMHTACVPVNQYNQ